MTHDGLPGNGILRRSSQLRAWLPLLYTDRWILISWIIALGLWMISSYGLVSLSRTSDSPLPFGDVCLMSFWVAYLGWSAYWGLPGCVWLLYRAWRKLFAAFAVIGFSFAGPLFFISLIALVFYPPLGGGIFHFARRWWLVGKRTLTGDDHGLRPPLSAQAFVPGPATTGGLPAAAPPATSQPPLQAPPQQPSYVAPPAIQPVFVQPVYVQPSPQWVAAPEPARNAPGSASAAQSETMPAIEQQLRALEQLRERSVISQEEHDRQRTAILDKIREPVSLSWDGRKRTLSKQLRLASRNTRARTLRGSMALPVDELGILEDSGAGLADLTDDQLGYVEEPRHSKRLNKPDRGES